MKRVLRWLAVICVAAFSGTLFSGAPAMGETDESDQRVDIVAFNVLAPVWAAPVWYPAGVDRYLLDTEYRRARVTAYLESVSAETEVFCLQEVQGSELPYLADAIGDEFVGLMAHNDRSYWSNWLVPEIPWQPNGTAVFVRKSEFSSLRLTDLPLGDGNHVALAKGVHDATGQHIRIASIHLESDSTKGRSVELRKLMGELPRRANTADVLCGDVNDDTQQGPMAKIFTKHAFIDVLAAIGNREATHPWSGGYENPRWSILDHVLTRNARAVDGDVVDSGVWSIEDNVERIEANFRRIGSDHFPVEGSISISSTP